MIPLLPKPPAQSCEGFGRSGIMWEPSPGLEKTQVLGGEYVGPGWSLTLGQEHASFGAALGQGGECAALVGDPS